jgi:hypothetical protein
MIIMDDIQKKIREELAKVQNSKFAKQTDGELSRTEFLTDFNREKAKDPEFRKNLKDATSTKEYKANLKAGKEKFWAGASDSHREHIAKKAAEASLVFESKEQAEEIFWKCWGEDRGEKLYKKLAKEYSVTEGGIINLVRGTNDKTGHLYCPVSYEKLQQMKEEWNQKYKSYTVVVQTPGCDLLEDYDKLYKESDQCKSAHKAWQLTTPSVVFYCRFKLKNPTPQSVRDYCDSIGIPRIKNDLGQYKQIMNRWKWLTTKKSKKKVFNSYQEAADFLTSHPENVDSKKFNTQSLYDKMPITWRDGYSFSGWMIRKED